MPFSWKEAIENSMKKKIERQKRLALGKNTDYLAAHPDEANEFNANGRSASAEKRIKKEYEKRREHTTPTTFPVRVRMNRK